MGMPVPLVGSGRRSRRGRKSVGWSGDASIVSLDGVASREPEAIEVIGKGSICQEVIDRRQPLTGFQGPATEFFSI